MSIQITAKQESSRMCFVCGLKNSLGLHTSFYELEDGQLYATFTPREAHQGYPDRLHGGIAAAVLDETIGRAVLIDQQEIWGVTVEFNIRYRKPVPLGEEIRTVGRITRDTRRLFEGSGEILLPDGQVAVEGTGKYLKMPLDDIADFDYQTQEWKVVLSENDTTEVDF